MLCFGIVVRASCMACVMQAGCKHVRRQRIRNNAAHMAAPIAHAYGLLTPV